MSYRRFLVWHSAYLLPVHFSVKCFSCWRRSSHLLRERGVRDWNWWKR